MPEARTYADRGAGQLLIVKTGSTLPPLRRQGDFEDWIAAGLQRGDASGTCETVDVTDSPGALPPPEAPAGIVVSGSPAMVSAREPWSEATGSWLAEAAHAGVPILGICYGHQLLAHALGGRAGPNPRGREIGTVEVQRLPEAAGDPLLGRLPERFPAHVTHEESVLELPPGARRLAWNDHDAFQAFRWGERAWGVQFHPEFDAAITRGYIFHRRRDLRQEALAPRDLLRRVVETPDATALLAGFAALAQEPVRAGA